MSNLYYPIGVLVAEGKEIATSLQRHGDDITKKKELLDGIKRAINILTDEEIKEKMKEKEKEIDDDLENIKI